MNEVLKKKIAEKLKNAKDTNFQEYLEKRCRFEDYLAEQAMKAIVEFIVFK